MSGYEHLRRSDDGPVATVSLERPESRNALDADLIEEVTRCFEELSEDEGVRAVVLTGERFVPEWTQEMGLVHEVAADGELDAAVGRKVSQLLKGGPEALAAVKQLLRQVEAVEPIEAAGLMAGMISDLRIGEEGQEGLAAFLEKREPSWRREK